MSPGGRWHEASQALLAVRPGRLAERNLSDPCRFLGVKRANLSTLKHREEEVWGARDVREFGGLEEPTGPAEVFSNPETG